MPRFAEEIWIRIQKRASPGVSEGHQARWVSAAALKSTALGRAWWDGIKRERYHLHWLQKAEDTGDVVWSSHQR